MYRFIIGCINSHCSAYISFSRGSFKCLKPVWYFFISISKIITAVSKTFYKILNKFRLIETGGDV